MGRGKTMHKFLRILAVILIPMALAACQKNIKGTYVLDGPLGGELTFKSGGEGTLDMLGSHAFTYEVDGNTVKISMAKDKPAMTLTIKDDDTLIGPMGSTYKKKK
jgi:hypothetical protein